MEDNNALAVGLLESIVNGVDADPELLKKAQFSSPEEFQQWTRSAVNMALKAAIPNFKPTRTEQGFQTKVEISDDEDFVLKSYRTFGTDLPVEETQRNVRLAQQRLGGLTTPFYTFTNGSEEGIAATKVTPIDSTYMQFQGTVFVDDLLNLMEAQWQQGVFDPDIGQNNLGIHNEKLISFDFGRAMDAHDESIYTPSHHLHTDPFHIALDKLRDTINTLNDVNPEASRYMIEEIDRRFGVSFDPSIKQRKKRWSFLGSFESEETTDSESDLLTMPRSGYGTLAEQLRKTVKEKAGTNYKPVSPLVDQNIQSQVIQLLEERLSSPQEITVQALQAIPQVLALNARELADVYALKTLYDFLVTQDLGTPTNIRFYGQTTNSRVLEILEGAPTLSSKLSIDAVVGTYSDINGGAFGANGLEIDIAILKNCVNPMSIEEKRALRKKYGIETNKPVIVVGYAEYSDHNIKRIVQEFQHRAKIILVGSGSVLNELPLEEGADVEVVATRGILKDYYALADAAINAVNLIQTNSPLHNFVEATEGAPLFMVEPGNSRQYGFRQLKRSGVVRTFDGIEGVIRGLYAHLEGYAGFGIHNQDHCQKRAAHIEATRAAYLPVIAAQIMQMLGVEDVPVLSHDLKAQENSGRMRLTHPDSDWKSAFTDLYQAFKEKKIDTPVIIEKSNIDYSIVLEKLESLKSNGLDNILSGGKTSIKDYIHTIPNKLGKNSFFDNSDAKKIIDLYKQSGVTYTQKHD